MTIYPEIENETREDDTDKNLVCSRFVNFSNWREL